MKIIYENGNITTIETISIAKTNLAQEMIHFMDSAPNTDYVDIASWFGFNSDIDAIEYIQENVIEFASLCPHDVKVLLEEGKTLTIPQAGIVARCESRTENVESIGCIPLQCIRYGKITGLPSPIEGICYIVSRPVYDAAKTSRRGAADLYVVGETVRQGSIILGCKGLTQP